MKIIGISAFYHDSAACLILDGKIIAASQEERFNRIKHFPGFPHKSIKFCLEQSQLNGKDVDAVVFYEKPFLKFERLLKLILHSHREVLKALKLQCLYGLKTNYFKRNY